MKPKKTGPRSKGPHRRGKQEEPVEFGREWQELETQYDRMKSDWLSLAAQLGVSRKPW